MLKHFVKISLFFIIQFCFVTYASAQSEARIAQQYMKAAQYDKAIILLEDLYKNKPSVEYYKSLFTCYYNIKDFKSAKKLIKKQLKQSKEFPIPYFDRALVEEEMGNEAEAKKYFNLSKEKSLIQRGYISSVSLLFEHYNKIDEALDLLLMADKKRPSSSYKYKIAQYYGQLNRSSDMIKVYLNEIQSKPRQAYQAKTRMLRQFGQDSDKMDLLKKELLIKLQKSSTSVLALDDLLIWVYLQDKEFDKAYKKEISLDKRYKLDGARLMNFSDICFKNNQYELASNTLTTLLNYGVEHQDYIKAREKRLEFDLKHLNTITNVLPEHVSNLNTDFEKYFTEYKADNHNLKVQLLLSKFVSKYKNNDDRAIRILEEALEYNGPSKEEAECKLYLADLLLINNRMWDALLYYNQIDKSFEHGSLGHEARYRKAKVSFYQNEFKWSKDQLDILKQSTTKLIANNAMYLSLIIQESLNLDSNTFGLEMYARSDLYMFQKRYVKANELLKSLIKLSTSDLLIDDAYFMLSKIAHEQKDYVKEEKYLKEIIDNYPDILVDNALFNLGKLYQFNLENTAKASETYQLLLTNHPSSYWTSQARVNYREINSTL